MNIPNEIHKPQLLIDLEQAQINIQSMLQKARQSRVVFRPHFKTHQSHEIAEMYRDAGISAITVSSVDMAAYFAAAGWQDILIAFPVNILQIEHINKLAAQVHLALLVDNLESIMFLADHAQHSMDIWIEVDTGLHRTGIWWQDFEQILTCAQQIKDSPQLILRGILTHAGHTYQAASPQDVILRAQASRSAMLEVKQYLQDHDYSEVQVSIGDTPGCRLLSDFNGVDEIRPGNFIFFDLEQWQLGVCKAEEIAVAMACPIVSKNARRREMVLYGGAIHFSKEPLMYQDEAIYGFMAEKVGCHFSGILDDGRLLHTTQEHGVLRVSDCIFQQYQIGNTVLIYPVHSCLTVQAMGEYRDIRTGKMISTMVQQRMNDLSL
jgi:D-serine deaminase-like pyridoxal phosphate-dependent protein